MQKTCDTSFISYFDLKVNLTFNVWKLNVSSLICEFASTRVTYVLWWWFIQSSSSWIKKSQFARSKLMKVICKDFDLKSVLITIIAIDYQQDQWCSCLTEEDTDALCFVMITIVKFYDLQAIVIKILDTIKNVKFDDFHIFWRLHVSWHQSKYHQFNESVSQFN